MGLGGQRHAPAALPPGNTRYPLYRRLGGTPGPVWTGAENLVPTGIRSPDRTARSELLYRLSYPGPEKLCVTNIIVTLTHLFVLFCEWSSLLTAQLTLYKSQSHYELIMGTWKMLVTVETKGLFTGN